MIILSDEHYVLPTYKASNLMPSILAKEALRLFQNIMDFKYWCILDSNGKAYATRRTAKDTIKIRKPPKFDLTKI